MRRTTQRMRLVAPPSRGRQQENEREAKHQAAFYAEPETAFQFFCIIHKYGWNINGDGTSSGCQHCQNEETF